MVLYILQWSLRAGTSMQDKFLRSFPGPVFLVALRYKNDPRTSTPLLFSSRQPEPPKKEKEATTITAAQSKRADEWKDPWRRSKSPKKKLGLSVSPSRARRRRKTSASSASASGSSR